MSKEVDMKKIVIVIKRFFCQSAKEAGVSRYSGAEIREIMARPIDHEKMAEFNAAVLPFAEKVHQIKHSNTLS